MWADWRDPQHCGIRAGSNPGRYLQIMISLDTCVIGQLCNAPMEFALQLATRCTADTSPNPKVGCVLVSKEGLLLGYGFTQKAGGPHAEVMALRHAQLHGSDVEGATAYVTLEPCSHTGRTGPCCDALISAGIAKVVASVSDPNPLVSGKGFNRLRAAGVEVLIGPGSDAAREHNIGFFSRMIRGIPWVRLKIAATVDGRTALANGTSQWITSPESRKDGHAWRARADAILTGSGTVLRDAPSLDVRLVETTKQPHIAIIDGNLVTPTNSPTLHPDRERYIYTTSSDTDKKESLEALGVTVLGFPANNGKVNLRSVLRDLAERGVNDLHVEAGCRLNGALLQEDLVDELLVYLAPKLLGEGLGMASIAPLESLAEAKRMEFVSCTPIGPDLRIVARILGHSHF